MAGRALHGPPVAGFASGALLARKRRSLREVQCGRHARAKRRRSASLPTGRAINPVAEDGPRGHNELQSQERLLWDLSEFHRTHETNKTCGLRVDT